MPRLPNFFLAGAPKTGSTSLYHYLGQHPEIFTSANKEPHFFATEIREENFDPGFRRRVARRTRDVGIVANREDYLELFAGADQKKAVGEGSVCYLWSPTAAAQIAESIPDAKILVMLRDPAERAWSQYLHGLGIGAIRWGFREHIRRNLRNRSGRLSVHYPFLEFGLYAEPLCRYLRHFGANVGMWFYEDFRGCPVEVCREIFRFLGVSPDFSPDTARRYMEPKPPRLRAVSWLKGTRVWEAAVKITPQPVRPLVSRALSRRSGEVRMNPADRRWLIDYYREDIRKLGGLAGRDLDHWLR